jgi:hypothetical protein
MTETSGSPQAERSADESSQTKPVVTGQPLEEQGIRQPETSKEARNMAMLCHLLGIVGFFAPLVIWLSEKDKHKFVDEHGRAAMNYQISLLIYYFVCWPLCLIVVGIFLLAILTILHVVFVIVGAVKASRGRAWRYPIAIPFLQ